MPYHHTLAAVLRSFAAAPRPGDVVEILNRLTRPAVSKFSVLAIWSAERQAEEPNNLDRSVYYHSRVPVAFRRKFQDSLLKYGPSVLARHAATIPPPFLISEARKQLQPSPDDQWIFDLLAEFGMHDGIYCSYGKWMVAYVTSGRLDRHPPSWDTRNALDALGKLAVNQLQEMTRPRKIKRKLSQRETAVLRLFAEGHPAPAIARLEKISENTVRTHVKSILHKLDAKNIAHATSIATRRRLI
jgi:DNA-binding CsgD family transcriptional regulator